MEKQNIVVNVATKSGNNIMHCTQGPQGRRRQNHGRGCVDQTMVMALLHPSIKQQVDRLAKSAIDHVIPQNLFQGLYYFYIKISEILNL